MVKEYRNNEELFFSYYLDELKENGFIEKYEYEKVSFELSPKVEFNYIKKTQLKTKLKCENLTKTFINKHSYTPDFIIKITNKGIDLKIFGNYTTNSLFIYDEHNMEWITDVKGQHGGRLSTAVTFPLNQKWLFYRHGVYVQKIKPFDLFKQTFTPKKVVEEMVYKRDYYKKGKLIAKKGDSRLGYEPKTFEEWIKTL